MSQPARAIFSFCAALAATLILSAPARCADVEIEKQPPQVEERWFDPYHPSYPPPPVPPGLRAVTTFNFQCGAYCAADYLGEGEPAGQGVKATIRVTGLKVRLQLLMAMWLPRDASRRLCGHEQGHVQLSERIYDNAEQVAQEVAQPLISQVFEATGPDLEEARKAAILLAAHHFCTAYHQRTKELARVAGEYYDVITDHGRNNVSTKEAIKTVSAKYAL